MKIYLGGPMFDLPNVRYNLDLAKRIRALGYEVYCPNENASINDKTRTDITPEGVYQADIDELMSANIFLCQVAEDSGAMRGKLGSWIVWRATLIPSTTWG